jgi:predicted neuraminidase
MLLPLYHEFFSTYGYSCAVTADQQTLVDKQCSVIPGNNHLQPALVRLPSGRVAAYLRNAKKQRVLLSVLDADLEHWSEAVTVNLPNPNAPVDIVDMANGQLLMVYNRGSVDRTVLSLATTRDGIKFDWLRDLENDPNSKGFSYPSIIRDRHRLFHVVYTYRGRQAIKHVAFDDDWLRH